MRYSIQHCSVDPAEKIRTDLGLTLEEFSVKMQWSARTYPAAVLRGHLTRRMAREIARRFKLPMSDFTRDGK